MIPLCQGMNIMSVDVFSVMMVTVGGERCTIDLGTTTDRVRDLAYLMLCSDPCHSFMSHQVLSCQPPQNLSAVSTGSSKKREAPSNGKVWLSTAF